MKNMKKIGIMTMQRVVNYGSFLQAYALHKVIKNNFSEEVEFIDYKFGQNILPKERNILKRIVKNLTVIGYIKKKSSLNKFSNKYAGYINKYLGINERKNYSKDIETLVIGSDEVFNCIQHYPVGFSPSLFGYGYEGKNVISYAASFGYTDYKLLQKYNVDKKVKELLKAFKSISVRDQESQNTVKSLIGVSPEIHLDPVLIGDFSDELKNKQVPLSNYIIVYAYPGRLTNQEEQYIKKFAKKYNKTIISLGFYQRIADKNLIVDPFTVLAYFKKADFVITDTFHGSVFSIKTNTKFCTIIRSSNRNKLNFLLCKMKHQKQTVKKIIDIEEKYLSGMDFDESNNIISKEQQRTLQYLRKNI